MAITPAETQLANQANQKRYNQRVAKVKASTDNLEEKQKVLDMLKTERLRITHNIISAYAIFSEKALAKAKEEINGKA